MKKKKYGILLQQRLLVEQKEEDIRFVLIEIAKADISY